MTWHRPHLVCLLLSSSMIAPVPASAAAGFLWLRDSALMALTDSDRQLQQEAAMTALDSPGESKKVDWRNPDTGASGQIEALGRFKAEDGSPCRKLNLQTQAKGVTSQFAFPVCKDAAGLWYIASGKNIQGLQ